MPLSLSLSVYVYISSSRAHFQPFLHKHLSPHGIHSSSPSRFLPPDSHLFLSPSSPQLASCRLPVPPPFSPCPHLSSFPPLPHHLPPYLYSLTVHLLLFIIFSFSHFLPSLLQLLTVCYHVFYFPSTLLILSASCLFAHLSLQSWTQISSLFFSLWTFLSFFRCLFHLNQLPAPTCHHLISGLTSNLNVSFHFYSISFCVRCFSLAFHI